MKHKVAELHVHAPDGFRLSVHFGEVITQVSPTTEDAEAKRERERAASRKPLSRMTEAELDALTDEEFISGGGGFA